MSDLTKRVILAVPAAAAVLWITWMGGLFFELLMAAIALITIWEVHRLLKGAGRPGYLWLSVGFAALIWSFHLLPKMTGYGITLLILAVTLLSVLYSSAELSRRWVSTLFAGIYAPVGFLMMVHLRDLGAGMDGFWLTVTLFFMIWGNDVFAYFGGKKFGKHALAPNISPKKTWEGFWFGFAGAAAGFLIVWLIAAPYPLEFWAIGPAVVIISTLGPLGDITASSLKRKAGVKDSSSLLPGHGGLFDRFDSMILSAPFLFFFFLFIL